MKTLILFLSAATFCFGQSGGALPYTKIQFFDNNGVPVSLGKVCTYAAGTNTPLATYTDGTLMVQNADPVALDASGRAAIWIGGSSYKIVLQQPGDASCPGTGSVIWTQDHVQDNGLIVKVLLLAYEASLAASTGSGLVGFSQSSTYSAGTVGAHLQQTSVSVKDKPYLATGDGSTDDSAAIQAAIDAVSVTHGTLIVPCGDYAYSAELVISSRITMQGGGSGDAATGSHACTTLTKTADVAGIHITDGANFTTLKDFYLTSTASAGTSDGILIGDITSTNGAGEVRIENVVVAHQKGNGINVRNGNSGVLDHVTTNANGINGVLISSQNTTSDNTNAWRIYSHSGLSNTQDGLSLGIAATTHAYGFDEEGNGRYGVYSNRSAMTILGHAESNTTDDFFSTASSFGSHVELTTPGGNAKMVCGSALMYCVNLQSADAPHATPDGRFGTTGGFTTPVVDPTYGSTVTINNNLGNSFYVTATDGSAFTISAPSGATNFSQRITVTIKNSSGGDLGAITWSSYVMNGVWTSPADGCSRSIDFQLDAATVAWTEISRTTTDVCVGTNNKADFVYSRSAPVTQTGLTSSGSMTAFSYPNIPAQSVWQTSCHIYTTTAGGAGTATLFLQPRNVAGATQASGTLNLTSTSSTLAVTDFEIIPANTSARSIGVAYFVTANSGGIFSAECVTERIQ